MSKQILNQSVIHLEKTNENEQDEISCISKEDKQKIKDVRFMRIKVLIYPWVGIIIWGLSTIYRIADDLSYFFTKLLEIKVQ